jgi:hypothetical protein
MVKHLTLPKGRSLFRLHLVSIVPLMSALLIMAILGILGFDLWRAHAQIMSDGERTTHN